jgi:hypothetical protein
MELSDNWVAGTKLNRRLVLKFSGVADPRHATTSLHIFFSSLLVLSKDRKMVAPDSDCESTTCVSGSKLLVFRYGDDGILSMVR